MELNNSEHSLTYNCESDPCNDQADTNGDSTACVPQAPCCYASLTPETWA